MFGSLQAMGLNFDPIEEAGKNWRAFEWGSVDAMLAATSITRVQQIMHARIDAALAPLGLNFSRFEVLALLVFSRNGELPMGKLGDRLQVHAASVTNTITRLEDDSLVERVPHPNDGRVTLARILPDGIKAAKTAESELAEIDYGLSGLDLPALRDAYGAFVEYRRRNGDFA